MSGCHQVSNNFRGQRAAWLQLKTIEKGMKYEYTAWQPRSSEFGISVSDGLDLIVQVLPYLDLESFVFVG